MAASTYVPAPRRSPSPRELAAAAAARTAPRGAGLAEVVALSGRGMDVPSAVPVVPAPALRPALRLVDAQPPTRHRRRAVVLASLVATVLVTLAVFLGGVAADARSVPLEVAGHVVLQPGETLWDVAVRSAPAGVDPRRQLDDLRRLNSFGPGALDAWTVVLIPAP